MSAFRRAVVVAAMLGVGAEASPVVPVLDGAALEAVTRAVRARMGAAQADVAVDVVQLALPAGRFDEAVVAPGGSLGVPAKVWFMGPRATESGRAASTVGTATLVLRVSINHAHTAQAIRHGRVLGTADVVPARHVLDRGPLRRLPLAGDVAGARLLRDLPAGACLLPSMFATPPAVTVGAEVEGVIALGRIEVRGTLVALDSGQVGDRIRVRNPASRRVVRATVVARGRVEIGQ